jgi:adenylate cyclase
VKLWTILRDRAWFWGMIGVAAGVALWLLDPGGIVGRARETTFELLGTSFPRAGSDRVVVVDIDRESLARLGEWPWRRGLIADLVTAAAAGKPRAIAIDILLSGPDRKGPAALARELTAALGKDATAPLPADLPDDDKLLADAITKAGNVVLGMVLDDAGRDPAPFPVPVAAQGAVGDVRPWRAEGVLAPFEPLTNGAAGTAVLSFRDGPLGRVASAPILAIGAGDAFPGLAMEAARIGDGASLFTIKEAPPRVAAGAVEVPIDATAGMRMHLSAPQAWAARSIPAWRLLSGDRSGLPDLAGRYVLIGSSAPEAGAQLPIGDRGLAPTVQIQADALDQMLSGDFPKRPEAARWIEPALMAALGLAAVALAATLSPLAAATAAFVMILAWFAIVAGAFVREGWLLDPIGPAVAIFLGANITDLAGFIRTRATKAAIQGRFERYLAPEIVARLVREPDMLRLEGELREVTALMTDVEGFSAMTESADPQKLVHVLDAYFDGVTELVVGHGGMVDKIVGDAVLAFFNIPAPVAEHPKVAVRCAQAIEAFASKFRRGPEAAALGFGRTRCGIETGMAIVGDVGGRRRLDYTAYGVVVNKAARFQGTNKELGSSICVGEVATQRVGGAIAMRSLGKVAVRGMQERCQLFEPWDSEVPDDLRLLYDEAMEVMDRDPAAARALLEEYAAKGAPDRVVRTWLTQRLPA